MNPVTPDCDALPDFLSAGMMMSDRMVMVSNSCLFKNTSAINLASLSASSLVLPPGIFKAAALGTPLAFSNCSIALASGFKTANPKELKPIFFK